MGNRPRRFCQCVLSGRAWYAKRCPRCGLRRDTYQVGREPLRLNFELERARARNRREEARRRLAVLEAVCQQDIPPPPVARPPSREMTYWERRHWEYRAAEWESWQRDRIIDVIRQPLVMLRLLRSIPVQQRYVRAAERLVADYIERARAAGWDLTHVPDW